MARTGEVLVTSGHFGAQAVTAGPGASLEVLTAGLSDGQEVQR
jgi:hypothetical protein